MPSFSEEHEIEFEVYCDTCGNGLCDESTTTRGNYRGVNQVRVNACPHCMKEKQEQIDDLESKVSDLDAKIIELENKLNQYE